MALNTTYSQANSQRACADNTRVLGLCTGALAAAAISCSRDTLELIPLAVDAVVVAFRTGKRVTDVATGIEPLDASDSSWSTIIAGATASESISSICKDMVRLLSSLMMRWWFCLSVTDPTLKFSDEAPY